MKVSSLNHFALYPTIVGHIFILAYSKDFFFNTPACAYDMDTKEGPPKVLVFNIWYNILGRTQSLYKLRYSSHPLHLF